MQSVIAAFDDTTEARQAVERLVQQGFSRDLVHIQEGYAGASSTSSTGTSTADDSRGFFSSVGHFFSSLFDGDDSSRAGHYSEAVRRGSTVVVVDAQTDDEAEKARAALYEVGAVDIDARAQDWQRTGWTGFDPEADPLSQDQLATERQTVLPVLQEELQVGKLEREAGTVRVVKRMTETPVSELVRLREERAVIERRPVDRVATEADFASFKEGTIELRETTEEAVVGKKVRVVEEVVVGTEVTEHEETVSGTVRRTDVDVERVAADVTRSNRGTVANPTSSTDPLRVDDRANPSAR